MPKVIKTKCKNNYLSLGLIGLTLVSSLVLSGSLVSANDVVDQINITVPISCTISGVGMASHNANINNGTYTADIGTTTLKAFCNDTEGFSIYAIGFTGDQYTGDDHTKLIGSSTNGKIVTGTATTTGNPDVSNWAMKLSTTTSPTPAYPITITNSFDSYHAVPDTYTKVATRLSSTDVGASATGSELTTTYAAYVSKTQPADTYTGKVKYLMIHPNNAPSPGSYTITYNANGGSGTMNNDLAYTFESFTLTDNAFTAPTGSEFIGWCTTNTSQYSCLDGVSYENEADVLALASAGGTITLYAYWTEPMTFNKVLAENGKTKLNGYYKIQDVSPSICAEVESGQIGQVIDSRDNEVYYIGKLASGRCWMLDNLRLGGSSTIALTPANTNIATNYTLPASTTTGFTTYATAKLNAAYENDVAPVTYGSASGKVGVYYNYCAATAGTFCYDDEYMYQYGTQEYDEEWASSVYDVCPFGWRIPIGLRTTGEYYLLTNRNSLSTPLSGIFNNSSQTGLGTYGYFWSSSHAPFENYGYRDALYVTTQYYMIGDDDGFTMMNRKNGVPIRCILSE